MCEMNKCIPLVLPPINFTFIVRKSFVVEEKNVFRPWLQKQGSIMLTWYKTRDLGNVRFITCKVVTNGKHTSLCYRTSILYEKTVLQPTVQCRSCDFYAQQDIINPCSLLRQRSGAILACAILILSHMQFTDKETCIKLVLPPL